MNAPTNSAQDPLAQLQDIHLPPEISNWPPAWGWWLVASLSITILATAIFLWRRHKTRNRYRLQAIAELELIQQKYTSEKNAEYLQSLSIILRRTALSGCGSQFNAGLKGEDWLKWLDSRWPKPLNQFNEGVGRALLIGPYQKNPEFNRAELHLLALDWIKQHRNQWQPASKKLIAKQEAANHV